MFVSASLAAAPAGATLAANQIGCDASVSVNAPGGATTLVDAADAEVRVPRRGDLNWRGLVGAPTHGGHGAVRLQLGLVDVELGRWDGSPNPDGLVRKQGSMSMPWMFRYVPAGRYRVEGFQQAREGTCHGSVVAVVGGAALTTLATRVGAGVGVVVAALVLLAAGRARRGARRGRPILGAFAGAAAGLFLACGLLASYVVTSDHVVVSLLPAVVGLGGLALGAVAPFGRPR